jgi:hypothetical protein
LSAKVRGFIDLLADRFGTEPYRDHGIPPRGDGV